MTEVADFRDTGTACWARFKLSNGEPCWIGVAQTGVLVKRSKLGLLGTKLYNEAVFKAAECSTALDVLFPERRVPAGMSHPVLSAFANAILHCSSASEVTVVLNTAVDRASSREE